MTSRTRSRNSVQSLDRVIKGLKRLHRIHKSWRAVSHILGLPAGTLSSIVKDKREPKDPHARMILNMSALGTAPLCPRCGVVHTKRCPVRILSKDLFSTSTEELVRMLEERQEMHVNYPTEKME